MINFHGLITAQKGFDDNRGLRIDHILVNQLLLERCVDAGSFLILERWKNHLIMLRRGGI